MIFPAEVMSVCRCKDKIPPLYSNLLVKMSYTHILYTSHSNLCDICKMVNTSYLLELTAENQDVSYLSAYMTNSVPIKQDPKILLKGSLLFNH